MSAVSSDLRRRLLQSRLLITFVLYVQYCHFTLIHCDRKFNAVYSLQKGNREQFKKQTNSKYDGLVGSVRDRRFNEHEIESLQ